MFGLGPLNIDANLSVNVHDTYFVISYFHLVILFSAFTFFVIYLLRTVVENFRNIIANLILMLSTILMVLVFGKMITMLDFFTGNEVNEAYTKSVSPVEEILGVLSKVLSLIQIGLLILLAYCGFKTGLNYYYNENTEGNEI